VRLVIAHHDEGLAVDQVFRSLHLEPDPGLADELQRPRVEPLVADLAGERALRRLQHRGQADAQRFHRRPREHVE
jgi:hypothetical protein